MESYYQYGIFKLVLRGRIIGEGSEIVSLIARESRVILTPNLKFPPSPPPANFWQVQLGFLLSRSSKTRTKSWPTFREIKNTFYVTMKMMLITMITFMMTSGVTTKIYLILRKRKIDELKASPKWYNSKNLNPIVTLHEQQSKHYTGCQAMPCCEPIGFVHV